MKKIYLFVLLLALAGCAAKKVNFDQLQDRNGLFYLVNEAKPFTGEVISYVAGKVEFEGEVKNGLKEGIWTYYYPTGQKKMEGQFTDGLKEGTWSYWKENGQPDVTEIYKMGKRLGNDGNPEVEVKTDTLPQETVVPEKKPASKNVTEKQVTPRKQLPVEWERLRGGPVKYLDGVPYTGPVIKHFRDGKTELEGQFSFGRRSGKWTFYTKYGNIKDVRYY